MRENSPPAGNCCNGLFGAFEFTRFQDAEPPKRKRVYIIRIHRRGTPVEEVHDKAIALAESIGWDVAGRFLHSRLDRLSNPPFALTWVVGRIIKPQDPCTFRKNLCCAHLC